MFMTIVYDDEFILNRNRYETMSNYFILFSPFYKHDFAKILF